ncbi:amino acid ABC transporter permease [Roseibacterium sp. SDUM158016]|uniref:amino acid ABC transporter permease n=1 Tax=Roseicyclus sediminis TaxID=2980997 RepID=UPI0021D38F54|nr:amino acid ABC transporter permease [Roseibacterium sp. SDUM158016]MCU4654998.1 amino acid ABC transporter permease [Roseibacterium sp. SDUM158016]
MSGVLASPAFWSAIWQGALVTVSLTLLSMAAGVVLGAALAAMRLKGGPLGRTLAWSYVFVFRGVPVLILLFLFYYGLPRVPALRGTWFWDLVLVSPYRTALFVLTINNAAYIAEIFRGGFVAIPRGMIEAGRAVGMTPRQVFARIEMPLALRGSLGSLGNETVAVMKASAITSVITVNDLMGGARRVGDIWLEPLTPLLVVGFVYLLMVMGIDYAVARLRALPLMGGGMAQR